MQANTPFEERAAGFYNHYNVTHSTKSDFNLLLTASVLLWRSLKKGGGILHSNYAFEDPNHISSGVQNLFRGALRP